MFCYINYSAMAIGSMRESEISEHGRRRSLSSNANAAAALAHSLSISMGRMTTAETAAPHVAKPIQHVRIMPHTGGLDSFRGSDGDGDGPTLRTSLTAQLALERTLHLLTLPRFSIGVDVTAADVAHNRSDMKTMTGSGDADQRPPPPPPSFGTERPSISLAPSASCEPDLYSRGSTRRYRTSRATLTASPASLAKAPVTTLKARTTKCKSTRKTIHVHDGNARFMINPNCYVRILMDYIHETVKLEKHRNIDLCDEDGNPMRLFEMKPYEFANKRLLNREVYNIFAYEIDEDTQTFISISPLIKGSTEKECRCIEQLMSLVPQKSFALSSTSLSCEKLTKKRSRSILRSSVHQPI